MALLTQNSELKPHGIWNFSIPAWYTRLSDGTLFKTCPNAGACAKLCYARNGTYRFRNVAEAHLRNLETYLNDREEFIRQISAELSKDRFRPSGAARTLPEGVPSPTDPFLADWLTEGGKAVRIHDAGDFFDARYLATWKAIAESFGDVLFYAYTKEISLFRASGPFPPNFRYLYSLGGLEDHLIAPEDRRADVFANEEAIAEAGYTSQDASDLLAILLPTNLIGIPANNIRHYNKRMAGRRFSEMR